MKRNLATAILSVAILVVLTTNAPAPPPPPPLPLIQRNVLSATKDFRQFSVVQQAPELWIHVRNEAEAALVKRNMSWLSTLRFGGRSIVVHPPLIVGDGPAANQLRFFKAVDRQTAAALQAAMLPLVPKLQLSDQSGPFQGITWIAPGRLEIWLAPNQTHFGPVP